MAALPPPPLRATPGDFTWLDWYNKLYTSLSSAGGISWASIDKTGSSIADISNRSHALLTGFQGGTAGERYHLTLAQYNSISSLGTMATQNANNVAITGGLISGTTLSGVTVDNAAPYLTFSNGSAVTNAAGRMWYNGTTGSWNLGMGGGNITQQVGEELFVYGKASAAINDSPLQIVYQTGTVGASGVITFGPTVAGITNGNTIIGVATEPIANNATGRITSFGVIHGITTNGTAFGETWADGDVIWYNPVTGNPTKVQPVAPNIKVQIGTVINAGSGGSGSFQVEIVHGSTLGGSDSNVQFGTLATNNLIQYNGTYWTNVSTLEGVPIGSTTPSTGTFTNLTATGTMKFGTYTANVGLTTTGYITITDSSGTTRRLAVV